MKKHSLFLSITVIFLIIIFAGCSGDSPSDQQNHPPVIQNMTAASDTLNHGGVTQVTCQATDQDGDDLTFSWSASGGGFIYNLNGDSVVWAAPSDDMICYINLTVSDGTIEVADSICIVVMLITNHPPEIIDITADPDTVWRENATDISCTALDQEGHILSFNWTCDQGFFPGDSTGESVQWNAPSVEGVCHISVEVSDGFETVEDSVAVVVVNNPYQPPPYPERGDEWTASLGQSQETVVMIYLEGGEFTMGSPVSDPDSDDDERPQHDVYVEGFWMGKYEITQAQWEAVAGYNYSLFTGDNLPVEMVSWDDIQNDFINAMNDTLAANMDYRLPSEAEWEYACRAGAETRFEWGDDFGYMMLGEYAWYWNSSGLQPHDAGGKQPNSWGLYDMHGNALEWVEDFYHDDYENAPDDGSAWLLPETSYKVLRGGSWFSDAKRCRSAYRYRHFPSYRGDGHGFRLVHDL